MQCGAVRPGPASRSPRAPRRARHSARRNSAAAHGAAARRARCTRIRSQRVASVTSSASRRTWKRRPTRTLSSRQEPGRRLNGVAEDGGRGARSRCAPPPCRDRAAGTSRSATRAMRNDPTPHDRTTTCRPHCWRRRRRRCPIAPREQARFSNGRSQSIDELARGDSHEWNLGDDRRR